LSRIWRRRKRRFPGFDDVLFAERLFRIHFSSLVREKVSF
jgi:hypothetical protein